jgi:hypothetical protein
MIPAITRKVVMTGDKAAQGGLKCHLQRSCLKAENLASFCPVVWTETGLKSDKLLNPSRRSGEDTLQGKASEKTL